MKNYLAILAASFCLAVLANSAWSAQQSFDYTAYIDSSDRPGAPTGTLLTGTFSYDPDAASNTGAFDYYPTSGSASLLAKGENGFRLERETRVINVTPGAEDDNMTMQSFVSEEPNGWNMVFDLIEPVANGWLNGDSSLPAQFPLNPDYGYISLYFTDEGDWIRTVDATILSITVSQVPVPGAAWLFGSALLGLAAAAKRRR